MYEDWYSQTLGSKLIDVVEHTFIVKCGVRDDIVCSSIYLAERSRSLSFLILSILVCDSPDAWVLTVES